MPQGQSQSQPQAPYYHEDSGAVRFWVDTDAGLVGASIRREVLHQHFRPGAQGDEPLDSFLAHARSIEAAVRRRVAAGSIEPVLLREFDLREPTV